jgi:hypothetical protein
MKRILEVTFYITVNHVFMLEALHKRHVCIYSKELSKMASSGILRRVALARTDVSEELSASFIRVTRFGACVGC